MLEHEIIKLAELEENHWWYWERRNILQKYLRKNSITGSAVDIGSAGGGNTRILIDHGLKTTALEYESSGVEICNHRNIPVIQGDARQLPFKDSSIDLIVAFDVLEHIEEDQLVSSEMFRVLREGGHAFVAVPTGMDLWSAHDEAVSHVRRYENKSIEELLEGAGFSIESSWSWNVLLRPMVKLRRKKSAGSDLDELGPITNFALKVIVVIERYLPIKNLNGVTRFVEVRKLV